MEWTSVVSMRGMHAILTVCNALNCGCNEEEKEDRRQGERGTEERKEGKGRKGEQRRGKKEQEDIVSISYFTGYLLRVSCCYANMLLCQHVAMPTSSSRCLPLLHTMFNYV